MEKTVQGWMVRQNHRHSGPTVALREKGTPMACKMKRESSEAAIGSSAKCSLTMLFTFEVHIVKMMENIHIFTF